MAPKILEYAWDYEVLGLKDDLTPIRSFQVRVSLRDEDYGPGRDTESAKGARDILETILKNRPLVTLALGEDAPVGTTFKVRLLPYEQRRMVADVLDMTDTPKDGPGYVDLVFEERL